MKAYRHAAVAYIALGRHDEAVRAATRAYTICMENPSANRNDLVSTSDLVLRARHKRWDARERARITGIDPLLSECIDLIWAEQARAEKSLDGQLTEAMITRRQRDDGVERTWSEARDKEQDLRAVFAMKDPNLKKRQVPDCFIDRISFNFMIDPVVTKHGHSYERSQLLEHLYRNPHDPLTAEPLEPDDLRPNLALREACETFLNENEWAADF